MQTHHLQYTSSVVDRIEISLASGIAPDCHVSLLTIVHKIKTSLNF